MGCSKEIMYKNKLVPRSRNSVATNPYGAYIEINDQYRLYKGELITYANDTLFIMTSTKLIPIVNEDIVSFEIVLAQNRSQAFAITAAISMIPAFIGLAANSNSGYGLSFLRLGLITGAIGGIAALIESRRKATTINYPTPVSDLTLIAKYARFPGGFPEGLDISTIKSAR